MSVTGTWPEELLLFEKYLAEHGPDDGYPLIVNDLHFWVEVSGECFGLRWNISLKIGFFCFLLDISITNTCL